MSYAPSLENDLSIHEELQPKPTWLLGLGSAVPQYGASQEQARAFMEAALCASYPQGTVPVGLLRRIYQNSGIDRRHSVVADYIEPTDRRTFFSSSTDLEPFPTTAKRMQVFEETSVELAALAARNALSDAGIDAAHVTHLVISTCTGFFAPGPDVRLINELGLSPDVHRTILGFMGCYAGLSAMRVCHEIVQSQPRAIVLQVAVELCSLHYQKDLSPDTLVANALFADGAAAAIYAGSPDGNGNGAAASISACATRLCANSADQMSWRIGDTGFVMRLDSSVPRMLQEVARDFVTDMCSAAGVNPDEIAHWAVHPGGRKILESVQASLGLKGDALESSYAVLRDFGNMSSATILFVLQRELSRSAEPGLLCALAFGPGLTIEGALLRVK
jgi:predicted naringenin-chalcone synthase